MAKHAAGTPRADLSPSLPRAWPELARTAAAAAPFAIVVTAAVALAAAAIFRHDRFGSNAWDLGIYDRAVWGYSRFDVATPNTVGESPNLIGGHFQPLLFLLTPLYWIWADPRMLLATQSLLLALGSLPLFVWARQQLGAVAALCFQLAYLTFWGLLGGNLFDFHPIAFAAPIVSLALYALLTRRTHLLLLCTVLGLLVRENVPLTFAAIGIYAIVVQRRFRLGAGIAAVSIAWFLAVLKAILPALSGRAYAHWFYPGLGSGPWEAVKTLVSDPIESARLFFTPRAKQVALFNIFGAWLFLPLLSPLLIVMIPTLAERFFASRPEYWAQGFHYSLLLAPIIAFAAADTTVRIQRVVADRYRIAVGPVLASAILLAGAYFSFARLRPLDELRRYTSPAHVAEIEACLSRIPPAASVSATSALVPHLSRRRSIYLLDRGPARPTEYRAIDTYTWMLPLTLQDVRRLVRESFRDGYGVECTRPGTVVLRRGAPSRRLDPQLARQLASA